MQTNQLHARHRHEQDHLRRGGHLAHRAVGHQHVHHLDQQAGHQCERERLQSKSSASSLLAKAGARLLFVAQCTTAARWRYAAPRSRRYLSDKALLVTRIRRSFDDVRNEMRETQNKLKPRAASHLFSRSSPTGLRSARLPARGVRPAGGARLTQLGEASAGRLVARRVRQRTPGRPLGAALPPMSRARLVFLAPGRVGAAQLPPLGSVQGEPRQVPYQ